MYTSFELQKIANRCSILTNPYDYSLNNKIILNDITLVDNTTSFVMSYTAFINRLVQTIAEETLKDDTHEFFSEATSSAIHSTNLARYEHITSKLIGPKLNDSIFYDPMPQATFELISNSKKVRQISGNAFLFNQFNNFNINLDYYLKLKNIDVSLQGTPAFFLNSPAVFDKQVKAFKEEELEALFIFSLLLKESIAEELSYLFSNVPSHSYADLKSKKHIYGFLKDLENKSPNINFTSSFMSSLNRQFEFLELLPNELYTKNIVTDTSAGTFLNIKNKRLSTMLQDYYDKNFIIYYANKLEQYIAYYIEILHLVSNKMQPKHKDIILDLFRINNENKVLQMLVYNPFTNTFNPKVEEIIAIKDNALRFQEITNYLNSDSVKNAIFTNCQDLSLLLDKASGSKVVLDDISNQFDNYLFPNFVAKFVMATARYAISRDAIKISVILIEFAKKKGINLANEYSSLSQEDQDLLQAQTDSDYNMDPFSTFEYPENSDTLSPVTDTKDTRPTLATELDNTISNFREKGHEFTLKEVKTSESAKNLYLAVSQKIKLLNSLLIKQIRDIKTYNQGSKLSGLSSGKIDAKNLYKYDTSSNLFYNNKYEIKEADLAFGIILDASGSMNGEKINDGKISMVLLHETLRALNINHSIIDHTAHGNHTCVIRKYHDFKESKNYDISKSYAIMDIVAREGNNDAGALYYMEQALLKTHNKDKICVIFSDGQPTECSEQELKDQVKSMERKGIKVIGIGINLPEIAEYYKDYANGRNLNEMIKIITDILRRYVLEK